MSELKLRKSISVIVFIVGWLIWLISEPISSPQQSVINERFIIWILSAIWILILLKKE